MTREQEDSEKRRKWRAWLKEWMEEKHSCLVDKTKEEMMELALRALYISYTSGECRKLICHNPITFKHKYE